MSPAGVDVIIPCYNYARYLRRCAESVLQETGMPIRVLIIDDASADDSADEARRIAAGDGRVEVISHPVNRGNIATFNEGLAWVQAPYLLLLSADDVVAPGALARAVGLMEAKPEVAFAYGRATHFSDEADLDRPQATADPGGATVVRGQDFIRSLCAQPVNPVETATAVVRSRVQQEVGGYDPDFPHSGDLEMWLRCAARGDVGVFDAVQAFVRLHGANMRDGYSGVGDFRQRGETFRHFLDSHEKIVGDARRLKQQACLNLAAEALQAASNAFDNGRACAPLVDLAGEISPRIRRTVPYLKLALKRRIAGPVRTRSARPATPLSDDDKVVLSLVISTRDRSRFLPPFLDSLRGLTSTHPWEMVMVDNGSVDDTWAILSGFARDCAVPITLLNEPKPGLSHARNTGVRAAKGRIICFTDDDCYPQPDFIDSVIKVFDDNDVGFMGGRILLYDPEDARVSLNEGTDRALFAPGTFVTTGEIQGACMAFRRQVFDTIGLFDTAFGAGGPLQGAEDTDMVARACFAGWSGGFFPEPVIYHHHRRRAEGAARITRSYDYSNGAFLCKMLLEHPAHRLAILRHWYWTTPVFSRPSRRHREKFRRELHGAVRYAVQYAWGAGRRSPHLQPLSSGAR